MNFEGEFDGDDGMGSRYVCEPLGSFRIKRISAGSISYVVGSTKVRTF
jgi:hypothetical protein